MAPDGRLYSSSGRKGELFELKQALNSVEQKERKTAVKRVIAAMTIGKDVSSLFPDVIKNAMTTYLPMKKLVYLYIINYARSNPDLVILVVNTFVKDAVDPNPLVRALSLRTMALIRLDKITEYLVDPLHKALRDEDPYVRKSAAVCVAKLYDFRPNVVKEEGFVAILQDLLMDVNPMTVANAVASLSEIAESSNSPELLSLNAATVPKYLAALSECTEWGQIFILDAISSYIPSDANEANAMIERIIPRLQHANPGVVLAAVRILLSLMDSLEADAQKEYLIQKMRAPIVTLVSSPPEMQYVALRNINLMMRKHPKLVSEDVKVFFVSYTDPLYVKVEKLDILVRAACESNANQILSELREYAAEVDVVFARKSVAAIGRVANQLSSAAPTAVAVLEQLITGGAAHIVEEAACVLTTILRAYPGQYDSIARTLCDRAELISEPAARVALVWIVGELAGKIEGSARMVEVFLQTFKDEVPSVQLQILASAVRVCLKRGSEAQTVAERAITQASRECDTVDVRERAIVFARMLSGSVSSSQKVMLATRPRFRDNGHAMNPVLLEELLKKLGTIASVYRQPCARFHGVLERTEKVSFAAQAEEDLLGLYAGDDAAQPKMVTDGREADRQPASGGGFNIDDFLGTASAESGAMAKGELNAPADLAGLLTDSSAASSAEATNPPLRLLLPADKGRGLVVHGRIRVQTSGNCALHLELTNTGSNAMSGFAIQFNKNAFGFTPGRRMEVPEPLAAGATATTTVPLVITDDADIEKGVSVQIAIKSDQGGVVYFTEKLTETLDSALGASGTGLDKKSYLTMWSSVSDAQEIIHTISPGSSVDLTDPKAVEARLELGRMFVVAKRQSGGQFVLYFSALVIGPLHCILMSELTLPKSRQEPATLASRSPIGSIAAPFLHALGSTCHRLLS